MGAAHAASPLPPGEVRVRGSSDGCRQAASPLLRERVSAGGEVISDGAAIAASPLPPGIDGLGLRGSSDGARHAASPLPPGEG